jgi:hypothetical protein
LKSCSVDLSAAGSMQLDEAVGPAAANSMLLNSAVGWVAAGLTLLNEDYIKKETHSIY